MKRFLAMKRIPGVAIACALVVCCATWAAADQIYEIDFAQDSYTVDAGGTVDITVLLRETVTGGDTARLAPGNSDGIFFMGVEVDFGNVTSGPGSTVGAESDVTINSAFDDGFVNDVTLAGTSLIIDAATTDPAGIEVGPVSANVYEVELATITFSAGALGSVTDLQLADNPDVASLTVFADSFVIDSVATYGTATLTVTSVPEPSSMVVLSLMALSTFRRRRPC